MADMSPDISRSVPQRPNHALAIAALTTVAVVGLLMIPLPPLGRVSEAGLNLLHAPVFAGLTVLFLKAIARGRSSSSGAAILMASGAAFSLGVAMEFAQTLVGRQADWLDVWANTWGIAAGILWFESSKTRKSTRLIAGFAAAGLLIVASWQPLESLLDVVLQKRELPLLGSFETDRELTRWAGYESNLERTQLNATHGDWALQVDLEPGVYPGAALRWPAPDWSAYDCLSFDIALAAGEPLDVIVKVEDQAHDGQYEDRFHQVVHLLPGQQHVEIDLSDVAQAPATRTLDLRQVSLLQFFVVRPSAPRTFYIDNVRLQDCEVQRRQNTATIRSDAASGENSIH